MAAGSSENEMFAFIDAITEAAKGGGSAAEQKMSEVMDAFNMAVKGVGHRPKKRKVDAVEEGDSDDAESGGAVNSAELEKWRRQLKKADADLAKAQRARRFVALKLEQLGDTVISDPWTTEQLEQRIEFLELEMARDEIESEQWDVPVSTDHCRLIMVERMRTAIAKGCQFDGSGYIDTEGDWIDFEPDEDELSEAQQEDDSF